MAKVIILFGIYLTIKVLVTLIKNQNFSLNYIFKLTNFRVIFDLFLIENHFLRQLGQYQKLSGALNKTTKECFTDFAKLNLLMVDQF